jgi:cellulose synthase/poly-beta-1,6-N-acetylglucosamine synthase-like glycosyltransferase
MKPSLALWAEPVLVSTRRWFWLSFWLLLAPMGIYWLSLHRGQSLVVPQLALLIVAVIGFGVVNGETAGVLYRHLRPRTNPPRGLLQHLFNRVAVFQRRSSSPVRLLPSSGVPPLPFVSVVFVAYLPNEQDIIEETLRHWLTQVIAPTAGWEVILAYNTPKKLPVETRLRRLAQQYPDLILLPVAHSRSKAENLNAALQHVRGEMTCIFDADHHPAANCLSLAWQWLNQGHYDGVQGRNIIRNAPDNWLTHLVAVEFECTYGISHYGRSLLADTALFGGSNGYWRTAALRQLGFSASRLTEDIDATVRGLLQGYRFVHDPAIITTELAPSTLRGLWLQRQRWSQGWLEVAWRYTGQIARSPYLDPVQKTYWLMMLLFSQGFYPLVWQVIPMMLSMQFSMADRDLIFADLNLLMMSLLTFSIMLQVALAMRLRPEHCSYSRRHGVLYCLFSPVYFWLKVLIGMVALYNHLCGSRIWHVTARSPSPMTTGMLGLRGAKKVAPVKSRS